MMIIVILFFSFILTSVLTTLAVVSGRVQDMRQTSRAFTARKAAEAGVQEAIADLKLNRDLASLSAPFTGIEGWDANLTEGTGGFSQLYTTRQLRDPTNNLIGEYDVLIDVTDRGSILSRNVTLSCYAYVPSKADYQNKVADAIRSDAHCTVQLSFGNSEVFDYSYFINHWGWFFGNTIVSNGNVRSNGQFDFGGYASTINGSPRYESANGTDLEGYIDDNGDGVTDGSDGGVYSGFQIVNQANIRGMGALAKNQHPNEGAVSMPNISKLNLYEAQATSQGGTIKIGATTYVSGVLGDNVGEKQHLYLVGTAASPIVINGPVVVRGSVIISGVVTGKGTIYSGGNVYVPKNLIYLNPPATPRPANNREATVEAWLQANQNKDALGLFAKEHVVIGNYTSSTWQRYVSSWVNHPLNKSKEDAGTDGIQNTRNGLDGIANTADDDTIEDDGVWTVSRYTSADAARGLIPAGKNIGDVIPGSGEDIDGDGVYDGTTTMSQFNIPAALGTTNWAGNITGAPTFSSISTTSINRIDASFYTNHTLAALMISSTDIQMNGSIVSRNESIIYSAPRILMNHDERLTGRGGEFFGFYLPKAWEPIQILQWEFDRPLPLEGNQLTNPDDIAGYWKGTLVY
ncbi:MAG: hypothetical protein HY717_12925 [Planctomycetes bacterium]|nr:hypothetical protein [Planctomycetota bacterium]